MKRSTLVKGGLGAATALALIPIGQQVAQADAPPGKDGDWTALQEVMEGAQAPANDEAGPVGEPLGDDPNAPDPEASSVAASSLDGWDALGGSPKYGSACSVWNNDACTYFTLYGYHKETWTTAQRRADGVSSPRWWAIHPWNPYEIKLDSNWHFGGVNISVTIPAGVGFSSGGEHAYWSGSWKFNWHPNHYYDSVRGKCSWVCWITGPRQTDAVHIQPYAGGDIFSTSDSAGW